MLLEQACSCCGCARWGDSGAAQDERRVSHAVASSLVMQDWSQPLSYLCKLLHYLFRTPSRRK
jgi:hypothetical protein